MPADGFTIDENLRFTVTGPPITPELHQLLEPFGRGIPLTGIVAMPGEEPYIAATYSSGDLQFSVAFRPEYPTTI